MLERLTLNELSIKASTFQGDLYLYQKLLGQILRKKITTFLLIEVSTMMLNLFKGTQYKNQVIVKSKTALSFLSS